MDATAVRSPRPAAVAWLEDAACRGVDPDLFFDAEDPTPAQRICASCPVRVPCLTYALGQGIGSGIWGGMTTRQRRWLLADGA